MSYKFQKGDAKLGGAIEASQLTGTLNPASLSDADTDDIVEGSSNQYYTDARSRAAVSVTDAGGDGSMAYNSSTGVLTYTGPSAAEVRAHLSAGDGLDVASGEFSLDLKAAGGLDIQSTELSIAAGGVTNAMLSGGIASTKLAELNNFDTADLSEGSNLYYTDARSRAAVSVTDAGGDGSMAYNSSTGVLTFTGPSAAEVRAHFSGAAGIDLSSGAIAVNVDDSSLQISADALQVKALGITRAMLEADAVDGTKIADASVDTEHLAADAVDGTKIADDSVDSEHIAAGAVDFEHFSAGSVSGSALADAGIGNAKLLNSTISGIALGGTLGALSTGNGLSMSSFDGSAAVSDLTVDLDGATLSVGSDGLKIADAFAGEGLTLDSDVLSVRHTVTDASNGNFSASYGVNFQSSNMVGAVTASLPAIGSGDAGKTVILKVRNADQQTVRVQANGSQTIDGSGDDLLIESSGAAVTLVVLSDSGVWAII